MASSVYTYDLTYSDVDDALPFMTLDEFSDPSSSQVTTWISEVCGEVNSEVESQSVDPSSITSSSYANQYHMIRGRVIDYIKGKIVGDNLRDDPSYVVTKREEWRTFLKDLRLRPNKALGSAAPTNSASSFTASVMQSVPTNLAGSGRWFK